MIRIGSLHSRTLVKEAVGTHISAVVVVCLLKEEGNGLSPVFNEMARFYLFDETRTFHYLLCGKTNAHEGEVDAPLFNFLLQHTQFINAGDINEAYRLKV